MARRLFIVVAIPPATRLPPLLALVSNENFILLVLPPDEDGRRLTHTMRSGNLYYATKNLLAAECGLNFCTPEQALSRLKSAARHLRWLRTAAPTPIAGRGINSLTHGRRLRTLQTQTVSTDVLIVGRLDPIDIESLQPPLPASS